MAFGFSLEHVTDSIERVIRKRLEGTVFRQQSVSVVAGGSRGGAKNAMIAAAQAKLGRDPWFLTQEQRERMKFILRGLTSEDGARKGSTWHVIAAQLLADVKENFRNQITSKGGPFRALTRPYDRWKKRVVGNRPILFLTGDLTGGLTTRIDRF